MARYEIILEDVEIEMFLGLHAFEKESMQRVIITVRIWTGDLDWRQGEYLDYDNVIAFIRELKGARIETQEELLERIHSHVLSLGAEKAEIYSRKPDIFVDAKSVGLKLLD
ncbi:MAG: dihydroneopterin aldolase [Pseudomonadota bacterium]